MQETPTHPPSRSSPPPQRRPFWHPTTYKLLFLVEWLVFIAIRLAQQPPLATRAPLNLLWPLFLLYLVGCLVVDQSTRHPAGLSPLRMWTLSAGGFFLDQALKLAAQLYIAPGESVSLLPGFLDAANVHNLSGSFILSSLGLARVVWPFIASLALLLVLAPYIYRFYVCNYRQSFWSDLGFATLLASLASCILDLVLRGYVLDFLRVPHVVAMDLKDLYALIGVVAVVVEAFDNPAVSKTRKDWRVEVQQTVELLRRFLRFFRAQLRGPRSH